MRTVRTKTTKPLGALAVTLAAALTLVPPALAKQHPVRYQLTITGSQATSWHLEKHLDAGACSASTIIDGGQMIRFHTAGGRHGITVTRGAGGEPVFSAPVKLDASVERDADFSGTHPIGGRNGCTGTVTSPRVPFPCGSHLGTIQLRLSFGVPALTSDDPESPAALGVPNRLWLSGTDPSFGAGNLLAAYPGCPMLEDPNLPEAQGQLIPAKAVLREARLLARRPGPIVVHASDVRPLTGLAGATGRTAVAYNLILVPSR